MALSSWRCPQQTIAFVPLAPIDSTKANDSEVWPQETARSRAPEAAEAVLAAIRAHPLGRSAGRIGHVTANPHRFVQMTTAFGGCRVVDWLSGEPLPRMC